MKEPICIFEPHKPVDNAASKLRALVNDENRNRKVVVISIAGSSRQGKSFILNFWIRYLTRLRGSKISDQNHQDRLDGFPWKHTQDPITRGILIWPEIFEITATAGKKVAVILMDTQGIFDKDISLQDSRSLFGLSILFSSVQIFNVMHKIETTHLDHLEVFAAFSRTVFETSESALQPVEKPFQELVFLVRDWPYPEENAYGWEGGRKKKNEIFENKNVNAEVGSMRENIECCFGSIGCFLMPRPLDAVFKTRTPSDAGVEFLEQVDDFIERIFRPENLKPKRINGRALTVGGFADFVERYISELGSGKYPPLKRLHQITVEAANFDLVKSCYKMYKEAMMQLITKNPQNPYGFKFFHKLKRENALRTFDRSRTMGDRAVVESAREILIDKIETKREKFKEVNARTFSKKRSKAKKIGAVGAGALGVSAGVVSGATIGVQVGGAALGAVLFGATGGAVVLGAVAAGTGAAVAAGSVGVVKLVKMLWGNLSFPKVNLNGSRSPRYKRTI